MSDDADRHAFYRALAERPSGPPEPFRFPPGIAGRRRKPWLKKHHAMKRTLREITDLIDWHLTWIADLWVASWAKTLPEIDFEARRAWLLDHIETEMAKGARLRVASVETGDIVGFVMIDPATGYLDQIAVHPDQWGAGIAEALIRDARRLSPERIVLDVNADNPRAVAFYEKQGFVVIDRGVNARSGLPTLKLEWRPPAETASAAP